MLNGSCHWVLLRLCPVLQGIRGRHRGIPVVVFDDTSIGSSSSCCPACENPLLLVTASLTCCTTSGEEHSEQLWKLSVHTPNIYMHRISVRFSCADLDGDGKDDSHPELQGDVEPDHHDDMQKVLFYFIF
jgi:hypothetical protein